jgi:2-oxo-4-hydroxy-4-carboxy--5-ureidoimidazoline (OHCU) decarboxylase
MIRTFDPALDSAGRLSQFLNEAIEETKAVDETKAISDVKPVNKFTELAEKVAKSRKAMDDRADQLSARLDKLNSKADGAFTKHETHLDQAENGLDAMEEALSGLIGHNGPND